MLGAAAVAVARQLGDVHGEVAGETLGERKEIAARHAQPVQQQDGRRRRETAVKGVDPVLSHVQR